VEHRGTIQPSDRNSPVSATEWKRLPAMCTTPLSCSPATSVGVPLQQTSVLVPSCPRSPRPQLYTSTCSRPRKTITSGCTSQGCVA
jgi:hypothetical protein